LAEYGIRRIDNPVLYSLTMKAKILKVGDRVTWYGESGQIVTVPADPSDEYGVKLDTGKIVFDIDSNLKEQKPCQK